MSYSLIPFSVKGSTASMTVCSMLYWLYLWLRVRCATRVFVACVLLLRVWCVGLMFVCVCVCVCARALAR